MSTVSVCFSKEARGDFRPMITIRFPRYWLMIFFGWQWPSLVWCPR